MQTGNTAASHDGLVAEVEVDAQEYANSVIATFHVLLNVFLHTQERGREVGRLHEIERLLEVVGVALREVTV